MEEMAESNMDYTNYSAEPGMVAFLNQQRTNVTQDKQFISELYREWIELLKSMGIDKDVRQDTVMDPCFKECFKNSSELEHLVHEFCQEIGQKKRDILYRRAMEAMDGKIQKLENERIKRLQWEDARESMQNIENQGSWVDTAIECIKREHDLMMKYQQRVSDVNAAQAQQKITRDINKIKEQQQTAKRCLEMLNNTEEQYNHIQDKKEEKSMLLERIKQSLSLRQNGTTNRFEPKLQEIQQEIDKYNRDLHTQYEVKVTQIQHLGDCCSQILLDLSLLVGEVLEKVVEWQRQFQLQYAELYAGNLCLDSLASWCGEVGKLLNDFDQDCLQKFCQSDVECSRSLMFQLDNLIGTFFEKTFLVTDQQHYIIKVDKKHLPKMAVRLLGALHHPALVQASVSAFLVYEQHLNECLTNGELNLLRLKNECSKAFKSPGCTVAFSKTRDRSGIEASFEKLQIDEKFDRPNTGKQVHEEKYRIVFHTKLNLRNQQRTFWTLSLPVVVTTGANQACLSQASIMWECFYCPNVFMLPIQKTDEKGLAWSQVSEMLDLKIRRLCPERGLTSENKRHLKRRLLGDPDKPDETEVKLKQFCFDKMGKKVGEADEEESKHLAFSFWKWFLGNYNLIDKYLLPYWKDGLIAGFLSSGDAVQMLNTTHGGARNGMFILRFSDNNIVDSQGLKTVFGHITACVMKIITEEATGRKKKKIYDKLDVAGHKILDEKNLATILHGSMEKKTNTQMYQYVYPGERSREDTFDKYMKTDTVLKTYTGGRVQWVIDLEQSLAEFVHPSTPLKNKSICKFETGCHSTQSYKPVMSYQSCLRCKSRSQNASQYRSAIDDYTGKHKRSPSIDSTRSLDSGIMPDNDGNGNRRPTLVAGHPTLSSRLFSHTPQSPGNMSDFSVQSSPQSNLVEVLSPTSPYDQRGHPSGHSPRHGNHFPGIPTTFNPDDGDSATMKKRCKVIIEEGNDVDTEVDGQITLKVGSPCYDGNQVVCTSIGASGVGLGAGAMSTVQPGSRQCAAVDNVTRMLNQLSYEERRQVWQMQGVFFPEKTQASEEPPYSQSLQAPVVTTAPMDSGGSDEIISRMSISEILEVNSGNIDTTQLMTSDCGM